MRNKIFTALLAVAVIVLLYIVLTKKDVKESGITPVAKEMVKAEVKAVNKVIDQKGFEHAVISDKENIVSSISQLDSAAIKELDSVKAQLNIKDKQLKQWINYSVSLEGRLLQAQRTDTSFRYQDQWANIEYIRPTDTIGNGYFNFKYNAEINYAEYWKRDWLLGPKKHYIDFWVADKRASVNGVKRIKYEVKESSFGLDVSGKALFNGVDQRIYIGSEASIDIGRFNISGSYLYSPVVDRWYPFVSGKYRLLEF
ncbi:Uncharacterised protein [Sphingobacterium spiritivorum]|uniref:Uncharacterized protein n=1 Tax=Sphingobacterium spiritivorum TaxID=258 RepID=A0A380CEK6_SPHSI|nr:hypothetical protein [Sphingobacterium spiritivorum]SUJ19030.1 Uncharacterised protein [Sphingobacterium spiritivorum]